MFSSVATIMAAHLAMLDSKRKMSMHENKVLRMSSESPRWESITPKQDRCNSCGSREFKDHEGRTICTYCRSTVSR
jgi:hypothetical protein